MNTLPSIRRWWLLATLALAQLMIALDTTVITIALPSAQSDLGFADSAQEWIRQRASAVAMSCSA